ncbi:MAG: acyl-CoA dehydrogenase family protein [Gammaproteobacteria bacterium]
MALHYGLGEDGKLIAASAARLLADLSTPAARRGFMRTQQFDAGWHAVLGGSGLLGICAPGPAGAGLGASDALAVMLEAGCHVVPWPVAESIAGAALLARGHPMLAARIVQGDAIVAFAPPGGVQAHSHADGWRLSGDFDAVPWAPLAQWLVLEANFDGGAGLALVELSAPGVACQPRKGIDPCCPVGRVVLDGAMLGRAARIGAPDPRVHALRTLLACAEMLGAAQACLDLAVDYMKVRRQFGQEIGRFQALKHIAANDALYLESMRLAIEYAAWAHDAQAPDADVALHTAKEYCSDQARTVAEDAIQCHGGIGFTWDHDLHLYLRRILRLGASLGTASEHREAIASLLVDTVSR